MTSEGPAGAIGVSFELWVSSFCGACARTRSLLASAVGVLPGAVVTEHDVAFEPDLAEENAIASTPTVVVLDADGREVFRAAGVPTLDQIFGAAALAIR